MTSNADRRRVVGRIRRKNEDEFGEGARAAVQKLLSAGLPHSWMYIYELTQNAVDAGASRVCWRSEGDAVTFQHDGPLALEESHVKGLSSLGASTKGLATVGFMGVGFKSVFARFREARVSDADWRFRFDVRVRCGDLESKVPEWFDTLRPHWDDEVPAPDAGYTTAFLLGRPAEPQRPVTDDLELLASTANRTTLAVLARRGLTQVSVEDVVWELSVEDDIVTVRHSGSEARWRWKAFVAHYRPDDAAMRRFLEVRQETHEQADPGGGGQNGRSSVCCRWTTTACRSRQTADACMRRCPHRSRYPSDSTCRPTGSSTSTGSNCARSLETPGRKPS